MRKYAIQFLLVFLFPFISSTICVSENSESKIKITIPMENAQESRSNYNVVDFKTRSIPCQVDLERVRLFKAEYSKLIQVAQRKFGDKNLNAFTKCAEQSEKLRENADQHYHAKRYMKALLGYNMSTVYAPLPNATIDNVIPPLSLAFEKRSAVLIELEKFEDAIRNIELAIKSGYPVDELKHKMQYCDQKQMLKKLATDTVADDLNPDCILKRYKEETIFRIQNPNPLLPVAEDFVEIQVDSLKGRQLILTKDVPAGTVVVVEEPFVKNLKKELEFDFMRCHFCFKKIYGGIPCPGCVFAVYCDDICLSSAAIKYHSYQCKTLPYLHVHMKTKTYTLMAFKIVCTIGPHKLMQIFETRGPHYFSPGLLGGLGFCLGSDPVTGIYDTDSYLAVYQLASQTEYLQSDEKLNNTLNGIILAEVLDEFTDFYSVIDPNTKSSFQDFVASVIIHHLESLACNAISLGEIGTNSADMNCLKPVEFGGGLYTVCSLINHSCFPNVTRVHDTSKGKISIMTILDLKSGQELLTTYGRVFYHHDFADRQNYLQTNFNFSCDCDACVKNWPLLEMCIGKSQFCCSSTKCLAIQSKELNLKQDVLSSNGICLSCLKSYDLTKLREQCDFSTKSYHDANQLILCRMPLGAIEILKPCIKYFQRAMSFPNISLILAQDLLKRAIDLIVGV